MVTLITHIIIIIINTSTGQTAAGKSSPPLRSHGPCEGATMLVIITISNVPNGSGIGAKGSYSQTRFFLEPY